MVTAEEFQTSQKLSAWTWNPSDLDHMAILQQAHNCSLPFIPPATLNANVAFPVHDASNLRRLSTGQENAFIRSVKPPPSYWNIPRPTQYPHVQQSQCTLPERAVITDKPKNGFCAAQKKFLIFDQSGDRTRLFFSPSFALQNQILGSKPPASANGLHEKVAAQVAHQFSLNPLVEKLDVNDFEDGQDEILEDSEDIDALLYSDSDEEYDNDNDNDDGDGDGEDKEVTSTGHTPFSTREGHNKDNILSELTEEVASSDDSPKRQRLLDGRYNKPSLVRISSPANWAGSCGHEDDSQSSCNNFDSSKRSKKVKIRNTLKILENIIPGSENDDPLSILDKAIVYLKSMKAEAEALGIGSPEMGSAAFA